MVPDSSQAPTIIPTIARISMDCIALDIPSIIICSMSAHLYPSVMLTIEVMITPMNIGMCGSAPKPTMPIIITAMRPSIDISACSIVGLLISLSSVKMFFMLLIYPFYIYLQPVSGSKLYAMLYNTLYVVCFTNPPTIFLLIIKEARTRCLSGVRAFKLSVIYFLDPMNSLSMALSGTASVDSILSKYFMKVSIL